MQRILFIATTSAGPSLLTDVCVLAVFQKPRCRSVLIASPCMLLTVCFTNFSSNALVFQVSCAVSLSSVSGECPCLAEIASKVTQGKWAFLHDADIGSISVTLPYMVYQCNGQFKYISYQLTPVCDQSSLCKLYDTLKHSSLYKVDKIQVCPSNFSLISTLIKLS